MKQKRRADKQTFTHAIQSGHGTAWLVGTRAPHQPRDVMEQHLDELEQLAAALQLRTLGRICQTLEHPQPNYLLRRGKVEEIAKCLEEQPGAVLIFDDELSPTQLRNLEKKLGTQIYDRSLLILEIFLARAHTAEARLQVELARYEYLLPRLTRRWTHLERQRGGAGMRAGAGEKEIETDRRQIRQRITRLRTRLAAVERRSRLQQKHREGRIRLALVGYTNAGKSTLMDALARPEGRARNQLFATLDTTVRRLQLAGHSCLLSDTVGFIRKLPHGLIESFRSTLAEARKADLLLHVADISHPCFEEQISIVEETLQEIGAQEAPQLLILNKADCLHGQETETERLSVEDRLLSVLGENRYCAHHIGSAHRASDRARLRHQLELAVRRVAATRFVSTN